MESVTPDSAKVDARAKRARAIILVVMAALIAVPIVAYIIVTRSGTPTP
jgi:hypothetical protein